jgi:hypothetical protein
VTTMTGIVEQCPTCHEVKPIAAFGRHVRRPAGCQWDCIPCQEIYAEALKLARRAKVRREVLARLDAVLNHYGRTCACCGSTERLGIDHVNGDGQRHRQEVPEGKFHAWLIEHGFPEGFQTLCLRCNSSKRLSPACRLVHALRETP